MSSVLSFYPPIVGPPTKFFDILTGSYIDSYVITGDTYSLPIPFVVVNQVLDINVNQSPDVQLFIANGDTPNTAVSFQGKALGGFNLVMSLGPNMVTWLRNYITNTESLGSQYEGPLSLYIKPVMTKIQLASPSQGVSALNDEAVFGVTAEAPVSDEYVGGAPNDLFYTAWVFKKPMTVQYYVSGVMKYITMTSQFTAN
jgi:hypothetical protein